MFRQEKHYNREVSNRNSFMIMPCVSLLVFLLSTMSISLSMDTVLKLFLLCNHAVKCCPDCDPYKDPTLLFPYYSPVSTVTYSGVHFLWVS